MPVTRTVRVIRTWEFKVGAEYGDTYDSLTEKVTEAQLDKASPQAETRVVLEEHETPDAKPAEPTVAGADKEG